MACLPIWKCRFHKDEVRFLRYVVLSWGIWIEDERIKAVRNWPEPKLVHDIQVFIGFANFYWQFIWSFSKIAALLTSILKTTGSSDLPQRDNNDEVVEDGGDRNLSKSKSKKSKNAKFGVQTHLSTTREPTFLTFDAREAFNQLRQMFTKALILRHFDPECYIRIENDASGYTMGEVLNQLTSDHLISDQGQWHPIAYLSKKLLPAETRYETHNGELLAIVEAFKDLVALLRGL